MTYKQAAVRLACSERTVERMVAAGALARVQVGARGARVAVEDVDAYVRSQLGVEAAVAVPINASKRDAFFAKCGEIARRTGREKLDVVDDALHLAGQHLGRELEGVNDLTSEEASAVLDALDAQVRRLRLADGDTPPRPARTSRGPGRRP